jgi:hypothetical protein
MYNCAPCPAIRSELSGLRHFSEEETATRCFQLVAMNAPTASCPQKKGHSG